MTEQNFEQIFREMDELGIKPLTDEEYNKLLDAERKMHEARVCFFFSEVHTEILRELQSACNFVNHAAETWQEKRPCGTYYHLDRALSLAEQAARTLKIYKEHALSLQ